MTGQDAVRFIEEISRRSFGESGEWLQLSIEEKISRGIVGDCAIQLSASDPRMAEIGIALSSAHCYASSGVECSAAMDLRDVAGTAFALVK